jgi:hypothetical protein
MEEDSKLKVAALWFLSDRQKRKKGRGCGKEKNAFNKSHGYAIENIGIQGCCGGWLLLLVLHGYRVAVVEGSYCFCIIVSVFGSSSLS